MSAEVRNIFFLGVGGIGMSALARYFLEQEYRVFGYDKTESQLTQTLSAEGINIFYSDSEEILIKNLPDMHETMFIYTPAIPKDNRIYNYVMDQGYTWKKRAEVLGEITKKYYTIAVAGTHGKTTTSCIVSHLLNELNVNFTAFLGGIASNFGSNYFHKTDGENSREGHLAVVEADEFDRSFLQLRPNISILTSMDPDHLDIYSDPERLKDSFREFLGNTNTTGRNIVREGLPVEVTSQTEFYGTQSQIHYESNESAPFKYSLNYKGYNLNELECGLPGTHNMENSVAAVSAVWDFTTDKEKFKDALWTFRGVKRRFEILYRDEERVLIDDYAHHPTELTSFITSVRKMFPNKKLTGIFQPHLYSRTNDFYREFAGSLDLLDTCYLLPIYPARELPMEGVESELIAGEMTLSDTKVVQKEQLLEVISEERPEILLIMGAGDIDRFSEPLKEMYNGW